MLENNIKDYIDNMKDEIIKKTQELIQIPSVYQESNNPSMPFGESVNNALNYMLDLGKSLGFRTKNLDGYCGYIEFGEGEELLGIIGHLDVVPEGDGWTYHPFSATISDGKIFGRGAIDDKGPVISSLYAMKAVMDKAKVNKRVRLILGLNEENDWKCINYYKTKEELPTVSFSPDADFPCIYAEKHILSNSIEMKLMPQAITIKEVDCKNNALNVVPKFCSIIISVDSSKINIDELISVMQKIIKVNNFDIDIYKMSYEEVKFTSYGIQAHSAHPDLGSNAISKLLIAINEIYKHFSLKLDILDYFEHYIGMKYDGKSLGIYSEDESGSLTLNVGNLSLKNNILKISMNLRIPIHSSLEEINNKFSKSCKNYNLNYNEISRIDALSVPKENYIVQTLCQIFNNETNSNCEPIVIGGATYARAFKNCISFGPNFPGNKDMCHQTDEFISIDNLITCCKIYAKAILALGN